jgi:predicted Zn-dependent peptidase
MDPASQIQTVTWANGVDLRVQPTAGRQAVALALWWRAGRVDEGAREDGAAHLLEHLVCEALDPAALARWGGLLNGQSGREWTVWHGLVPAPFAPEVLKALVQALLAPLPSASAVEREARVLRQEIRMAATADAWESLALCARFGDHPLSRPLAVAPTSDRAGLIAFRQRLLGGPRLRITAAGDVDLAALVAAAEPLGPLPVVAPELVILPSVPDQRCDVHLPETAGAGALWLMPFESTASEAISWLADLLAHPLLGRLSRGLRAGSAPLYGLDSRLEWVGGMGLWWLRSDDARAIPVLESEMERALAGGFTDAECTRVESLRRTRRTLQTEDLMGCLERLAELQPEQGIEPPTPGALNAALAACWGRRCLLRAG